MRRSRLYALTLLMLFSSGLPAACSGGVVGGKCRDGYSTCDGSCVDPSSDRANCGSCDHACGDGIACVSGVCVGPDASSGGSGGANTGGAGGLSLAGAGGTLGRPDAASGGEGAFIGGTGEATSTDAGMDASHRDASAGGTTGDSGTAGNGGTAGSGGTAGNAGNAGTAGGGGTGGSDAGCIPPFNTSDNCGTCGQQCPADSPLCSLGTDGYFCTPLCQAPLKACGSQCVNTDTDENNCGRCGNVCASGLCQGGVCVGATAGHEILFCNDYRTTATVGTSPERLLENAVFLGGQSNVRILGYSEYTTMPVVTSVDASLTNAAQNRGRTYTLTSAPTSLDLSNDLSVSKFDVLLVYDQPKAPAGQLATAGASVADAIDAFVRAGGIVVVLASNTGRGEMPDFIKGAGLLDVTGQQNLTGNALYNRGPADAIGIGVLTQFRAPSATCTFTTTVQPDGTNVFVITDSPSSSGMIGAPVVVHRVVAP